MARFDGGIAWYTIGVLNLRIAFPEGEVKCKWCPHLRADEANGRHFCRLTGSIVYSKEIIADDCPIEFTGETVGNASPTDVKRQPLVLSHPERQSAPKQKEE